MPSKAYLNGLADSADWEYVSSSNVHAAAYFEDFHYFLVWFKGGSLYFYEGVPKSVWNAFLSAPSKGSFIYDEIRGAGGRRPCPKGSLDQKYPYTEVTKI